MKERHGELRSSSFGGSALCMGHPAHVDETSVWVKCGALVERRPLTTDPKATIDGKKESLSAINEVSLLRETRQTAGPDAARHRPVHQRYRDVRGGHGSKGQTVVKWASTTDHKVIGNLYFITSFAFFMSNTADLAGSFLTRSA